MKLSGWGRYPRVEAEVRGFQGAEELRTHLGNGHGWIVHGQGRSYGDSALNTHVLLSKQFNRILDFDAETGVVECESGVTLAELIEIFLPRGWFLAVSPGTKFVSVGGAIAADIHGKNHHKDGTFCRFVQGFTLMTADGSVLRCNREEHEDLFRATCAGMGLTGVILTARLRLRRVAGRAIEQRCIRAANLDQIFDLFEEHAPSTYSVAWIDCLARGPKLGRSVLLLGEHAPGPGTPAAKGRRLRIPFATPGFLLNKYSAKAFNALFYAAKGDESVQLVDIEPFFYPLDVMSDWNLLYGKQGFVQYQFVLPKPAGLTGIRQVLERMSASGMASFLGVLKLFGPENANLLSFPMEGYTLALDFKVSPPLLPLLEELDRIVLDHGGRLYLAKDARMPAEVFQAGYPRWKRFAAIRAKYGLSGKFASMQSNRLQLA